VSFLVAPFDFFARNYFLFDLRISFEKKFSLLGLEFLKKKNQKKFPSGIPSFHSLFHAFQGNFACFQRILAGFECFFA